MELKRYEIMKVKNKGKVHLSEDNGFSAKCGVQVGRNWTVTTDEVDCPRCLGNVAGWQQSRTRFSPAKTYPIRMGMVTHATRKGKTTLCGKLIPLGSQRAKEVDCLECAERVRRGDPREI